MYMYAYEYIYLKKKKIIIKKKILNQKSCTSVNRGMDPSVV